MKIPLELNLINRRSAYLNFWDSNHGRDVVCRIGKGGELFLQKFSDKEGDWEPEETPITFSEFIKLVKKAIKE